ncbi:RusA family crossover junction endodeoxyribonuclease [Bifidobacterium oedipodis]|uniref:Uncharacterized protein n=1 Tax=Bifidobacterium oedipodis TaxID=2675322 RepID=A0A7Y0EP90_9BIFI|nr:RusA family crossover junction endodeoxyribonuclease [Bifidobacterium sp. DSM 109957]NMM93929.1 hypothetical protein [Bifidobacterium sp. DSM 109957]
MSETNNGRIFTCSVQHMLPITKGSVKPYTVGHGRAMPDDDRLDGWQRAVALTANAVMRAEGLKPYDCPLMESIVFRMPRPKKPMFEVPATKTAKARGGGDLDKLVRAVNDGLQEGGVMVEDSRIYGFNTVLKLYADREHPIGATIALTPMTGEE